MVAVTVVVDERAVTSLLGARRAAISHAKNTADIEGICLCGSGTLDGYSSLYETWEEAWQGATAMMREVVIVNSGRQVPLPVRALLLTTIGEDWIIKAVRSMASYIGGVTRSVLPLLSEAYVQQLGPHGLDEIAISNDLTPVWLDMAVDAGTTLRLLRLVSREQQMQSVFRTRLLTLYDGPYYIASYVIRHDDVYCDILKSRYGAIECLRCGDGGGLVAIYETPLQVFHSLQLGDVVKSVAIHCGYDIILKRTSSTLEGSTYDSLRMMTSLQTRSRIVMSSDAYEWSKLSAENVLNDCISTPAQIPSTPMVVYTIHDRRGLVPMPELASTSSQVVAVPASLPAQVADSTRSDVLESVLTTLLEMSERLSSLEKHITTPAIIPVSTNLVDLSEPVVIDDPKDADIITANYTVIEPQRSSDHQQEREEKVGPLPVGDIRRATVAVIDDENITVLPPIDAMTYNGGKVPEPHWDHLERCG